MNAAGGRTPGDRVEAMHPFVLIPLLTCVGASAMAGALWARDLRHAGNRLTGALLAATAWWALCEVLWHQAPDAESAVIFARLASVGFMSIGPIAAHLLVIGYRAVAFQRLARRLPQIYAYTGGLTILYVTTPWFVPTMEPVPWGWSPVLGPAFPLAFLWLAVWPFAGLLGAYRHARRLPRFMQVQTTPMNAALASVFVVAAATELALPLAGIPVPRLGAATVCTVGAVILLNIYRYGHSIVTPGSVAGEILAAIPEGIAFLRRDGRVRFANENLARMLGLEPGGLRGADFAGFVRDPAFDPREDVEGFECEIVAADGRALPVAISSAAIRERLGSSIGHVVGVRDLGPVMEFRAQLVTTGRLAAVGELAAAITHELNNPIAFIRTNLGILGKHLGEIGSEVAGDDPAVAAAVEEGAELVADTLSGADRVAAIVRDVRRFSRAEYRDWESVDLNRLCEEALRVALAGLPEDVVVVRELGPVPPVACAPQEIVQVLLNVITNAVHAVGGAGTIHVRTLRDDRTVAIEVQDDGSGIPAGVIEKVFDPFFTTKAVGEGTGLGLAISRQIVMNHGGDMGVESDPARGTTFRIRLPLDRRDGEDAA